VSTAGMGMSQADVVAGGRPVVKGSMGMDDIDLDDDDVRSFSRDIFLSVHLTSSSSSFIHIFARLQQSVSQSKH